MLLVKRDDAERFKWFCNTCPYQFPIRQQMTTRVKLTRKQVDDIMGGDDAWKNVDSTDGGCNGQAGVQGGTTQGAVSARFWGVDDVCAGGRLRPYLDFLPYANLALTPLPLPDTAPCPKCENPKAFFMQVQIRSADEPSA